MKKILGLVLFIVSRNSFALEGGELWLSSPVIPFHGSEIQKSEIYEVVASKEYVAVLRDLEKQPFVEIEESTANYFTGHHFSRKSGQHTYLVRAVYTNGGTGSYTVTKNENNILITHSSLGKSSRLEKSALIVNLDFKLEKIYVNSSGAM